MTFRVLLVTYLAANLILVLAAPLPRKNVHQHWTYGSCNPIIQHCVVS
jgi:hypothetical protein